MGMSDAEYQRIVNELQASRAHAAGAVNTSVDAWEDFTRRMEDHPLNRTMVWSMVLSLKHRGAHAARAQTLADRVQALAPRCITHAVLMAIAAIMDRVVDRESFKTKPGADLDRGLAEMEAVINRV